MPNESHPIPFIMCSCLLSCDLSATKPHNLSQYPGQASAGREAQHTLAAISVFDSLVARSVFGSLAARSVFDLNVSSPAVLNAELNISCTKTNTHSHEVLRGHGPLF